MKRVITALLVTAIGLCEASADEHAPTLGDFAAKQEIITPDSSPLQRFQLSESIYETAASPQLDDLRIFNADGHVVPFEVSRISSTVRQEEKHTPLPVFPIEGKQTQGDSSTTEVTTSQDSDGKIVSVRFFGDTTRQPSSVTHYLVDLRGYAERVETLAFQWESTSQMVPVTIESSDDLKSWRTVGTGVLARLEYMGHSINQNTIDCGLQGSGYLRISTPDGTAATIKGVDAIRNHTDTVAPPPLMRSVSVSEKANSKTFLYDVGGVFPVSAVSIHFADQNTLAQVLLSSRPNAQSPWIVRLSVTAYALAINGRLAESGFSTFDSTVTDRYWKLETTEKESTLSTAPTLAFRWHPEQAIFLAQGKPPFTIAYGSVAYRHTPYSGNSVRSLAGSLNVEPSNATLAPQQVSGGSALLVPALPRQVVEWKKWALWGILSLVLLLVLWMAKALLSELKQG